MSRNPIQDNFVILCNELNVEKILPYLKQERMVTTDEYETLTSPTLNTRTKREKLLIWLPRKGRNYFTKFGKCLVWSGQKELARHIGVDVALVPEPPFKREWVVKLWISRFRGEIIHKVRLELMCTPHLLLKSTNLYRKISGHCF